MILEKIISPGLAHFSYLIGSEGEAFVIDPRRDIDEYLSLAQKHNLKIIGIFETHRNEDIVTGAPTLAELTGAPLYRSSYEKLDYQTATYIKDRQEFEFGCLTLIALHTPGHTKGHMSYLVQKEGQDMYLFSGDSLFFGDAGRTDFYGQEHLEKMTGLLYDTLFEVYAQIDDNTLLLPAHGAGSACGGDIQDRPDSTLGYERKTNPLYQLESKEEFIAKHAYMRLKPYYFEHIEKMNLRGPEASFGYTPSVYHDEDIPTFDCRNQSSYIGLHEKNIIHLNHNEFSSYLGWFANVDEDLHLITDDLSSDIVEQLFWTARRMGYDGKIFTSTKDYIVDLQNSTKEVVSAPFVRVADLEEGTLILDVRQDAELKSDEYREVFSHRKHIPLQLLMENIDKLDQDKCYAVLCKSGVRATIAYSILEKAGISAQIILGGNDAIELSDKFNP